MPNSVSFFSLVLFPLLLLLLLPLNRFLQGLLQPIICRQLTLSSASSSLTPTNSVSSPAINIRLPSSAHAQTISFWPFWLYLPDVLADTCLTATLRTHSRPAAWRSEHLMSVLWADKSKSSYQSRRGGILITHSGSNRLLRLLTRDEFH